MYTIKCVLLHLKNSKKNSLLLLFSLVFGLLLPGMVFGQIYYIVCNRDTAGFYSQEDTWQITINSGATLLTQDKLDAMKELTGAEEVVQLGLVCPLQIEYKGVIYTYNEGVTCFSDGYASIKPMRMLAGEFPSVQKATEESFCVVNKIFAQTYGVKVGDILIINGKPHTVCGIKLSFDESYLRAIMLPFDADVISDKVMYQQYIGLKLRTGDKIEDCLFKLKAYYQDYEIIGSRNGTSIAEIHYDSAMELLKGQLPFSILVLLFSVTNMIFVVLGSFERRQKTLAVSLMAGADFREMWMQFLAENMILLLGAMGILMFIAPAASRILYRNITFGIPVFAGCFLLGMAIMLLVSAVLEIRVKKLNPCEIIRQVL